VLEASAFFQRGDSVRNCYYAIRSSKLSHFLPRFPPFLSSCLVPSFFSPRGHCRFYFLRLRASAWAMDGIELGAHGRLNTFPFLLSSFSLLLLQTFVHLLGPSDTFMAQQEIKEQLSEVSSTASAWAMGGIELGTRGRFKRSRARGDFITPSTSFTGILPPLEIQSPVHCYLWSPSPRVSASVSSSVVFFFFLQ
jgi:hypothetical protein